MILRHPKSGILDPGCGTAVLTCSLVEHLVMNNPNLKFLDLVAYETDVELIAFSQQVLCYLKSWLLKRSISLQYILYIDDFVLNNADYLTDKKDFFTPKKTLFDIIISNPPYFKLSKDDKRTIAAKEIVNGQSNIYSLFLGIAAKLLKSYGQLIFITPRSFTSGSYFKTFREFFFHQVQLQQIHLFISRKDTFNRDNVLQETVIIKAIKKNEINAQVMISSSLGLKDIDKPTIKYFSHNDLINLNSKEKILHFPTNDSEESILETFKSWTGTLKQYDVQISTGPVVSFRAWDFIQDFYDNRAVLLAPLFWLHNVNKMELSWPIPRKNKGQYIKIMEQSKSILIPNKNYIFLEEI